MKTFFLHLFAILFSFTSLAESLCAGNNNKSALIVIDMQSYFIKLLGADQTPENKIKVKQVVQEQVLAIKQAREARIPVIFIEYDEYGETVSELKAAVENYKEVRTFKKSHEGMFSESNKYKKDLEDYLVKKQVGNLIVTGANGGTCVLMSIMGALENNCSVVAYSKGIADFGRKEFVYPYSGKYKEMPKGCKDCSFKETSSIDEVIQNMRTKPSLPQSAHTERLNATQ